MAETTVNCPHCKAPVTVAVGQVRRCPACGGELPDYVERLDGPASTSPATSATNPAQDAQPVSRKVLWLVLALIPVAILAHQAFKHQGDKEELSKLRAEKAERESPQFQWMGKLYKAKVGMTVEEVEAIMGSRGQKGAFAGKRGEFLARDHVAEEGRQIKVWAKVEDGKVTDTGRGGNFRSKPGP